MKVKKAVESAVNDCIRQGILREFLVKHKAQVIKMSIYEYDEEKQRKFDREEGREEGRQIGKLELVDELVSDGTITKERAEEIKAKLGQTEIPAQQ